MQQSTRQNPQYVKLNCYNILKIIIIYCGMKNALNINEKVVFAKNAKYAKRDEYQDRNHNQSYQRYVKTAFIQSPPRIVRSYD
jgi:hypothetical protein